MFSQTKGVSAPQYAAPDGGIPRAPLPRVYQRPGVSHSYSSNAMTNQPYTYKPLPDAGASQFVPRRWQATPKFALTGPGTVTQTHIQIVAPTSPIFLGAFNIKPVQLLTQGFAGVPSQSTVMQPLYNLPRSGAAA